MKTEYATFDDILHSLYENTGRIEVSFSSKMLATLHPNQPIWDKYVVHNLELTVPKKNIDGMVDVYEKIVEWYEGYIRENKDYFSKIPKSVQTHSLDGSGCY